MCLSFIALLPLALALAVLLYCFINNASCRIQVPRHNTTILGYYIKKSLLIPTSWKSVSPLWKKSVIIPVYKSGETSLVRNYRPITISTVLKIFQTIIYNELYSTVNQSIPQQKGFVQKLSVDTNLILYTSTQVEAVYTDFCKAFDK